MTEQEKDYAEGWRPEQGDKIKGKVVDIAATDAGYGVYPIVTLRRDDGSEAAVHAFHTVLRKELARRRPKVGDELEITYLGRKAGGRSSQGYDGYKVRSDQDVAGYDWDQELDPDERGPGGGAVAIADVPIAPAPPPAPPPAVPDAAEAEDDDLPF